MLDLPTVIFKFLHLIKTFYCRQFLYSHALIIKSWYENSNSRREFNICQELKYLIHYKYIGSRFNDISNIRGYIYNSIYLSFIFFKRYYAHKTNFTRLTLPLVYIRSAKTSKCEEHKAHHIEHVFWFGKVWCLNNGICINNKYEYYVWRNCKRLKY